MSHDLLLFYFLMRIIKNYRKYNVLKNPQTSMKHTFNPT